MEKLDMEMLQRLIYYTNNIKMSVRQRDWLHCKVVAGILHGEINTDDLFAGNEGDHETTLSRFLGSDALLSNQGWIQANKLYEIYDGWCGANGMKPESLSAFGRELKDLGLQFKKKADGNYYLIDSEEDLPSAD